MRNFKKVILLLLLIVIFEQVLTFLLEPITFQHYLEMELHQKESENMQPDMVFIGNSRVSSTFVPSVFTESMEDVDCAFNAGTGSQGIAGTYYYLKDILQQYDLKYVVVGVDYQTVLKEERMPKKDLVVLERLKSPVVKAQFMLDVFEPSEYIYFLKSYQYKNNIQDIPANLKQKLSKEYRQGIYTGQEGMVYEDLGFTREKDVFGNGAGIYYSHEWVEAEIDPDRMKYLDKIIELCKEAEVSIFLVSTPLTISTVYGTPGYEECCHFFKAYAEEKNVVYDNLNLLKGREEFLPDSKMSSMEHVGADAANVVSEYYCEIVEKRLAGEDVESYFYTSVEEMKENMVDIAACAFHTEKSDENGNRTIFAEALFKEGTEVVYQFEMEKNKETMVLQEYSSNTQCNLAAENISFPMKLRVKCQSLGDGSEKVFEMQIEEDTWE